MGEQLLDNVRVDRRAFSVTTLAEAEREDRDFWRSRTPDERLAALELSRQIAYGTLSCRSVGSGRGGDRQQRPRDLVALGKPFGVAVLTP